MGCGGPETIVWVQVGAPLKVPDDVDELSILARWGGAGGDLAFERSYRLDPQLAFPVTLSLTSDEVGEEDVLWVEASALKNGQQARPWARVAGETSPEKGAVTPLLLQMCDCAEE